MYIPTEDKLFDHNCQFKDMKLSAFNPKSLTYYCQVCGGKLIIEGDMRHWKDLFGEPITLKLNKRVLKKVLKEREAQAKAEEEEMQMKEDEAKRRAGDARKKAEQARKKKEKDMAKDMTDSVEIDVSGEKSKK